MGRSVARLIVQTADFEAVVVGEKELPLNPGEAVSQPLVVCRPETDVLVVVFGCVVGRIAVEKGFRSVILFDDPLEIPVFDHDALEPRTCVDDRLEILPHGMRLGGEGVHTGSIALAENLIEVRGPPDIGQIRLRMKDFLHILKVTP